MSQSAPTVIRVEQERLLNWVVAILLAIAIAIVLLDAVVAEFELVSIGAVQRLFNITREDGLANFFSTFQMLTVGFVALLITLVVKSQKRGQSSNVVVGWAVVTGLLLLWGVDDGTKLHERVGTVFKELATDSSGEPHTGLVGSIYDAFSSYSWQLVVGPIYAAAGLFLIVFLNGELGSFQLRALALVALALFAVAVAMDFIEGLENDPLDLAADLFSTSHERAAHFSKSVEEFLEMVGTTTLLYVFLKKLVNLAPSITFEVSTRQ